ncbi:hypothetical protein VB716_00420 [Synechococcus sp. CCY9201]|nr:hypothetical protein [Synechococcus sp. CCY9201]
MLPTAAPKADGPRIAGPPLAQPLSADQARDLLRARAIANRNQRLFPYRPG